MFIKRKKDTLKERMKELLSRVSLLSMIYISHKIEIMPDIDLIEIICMHGIKNEVLTDPTEGNTEHFVFFSMVPQIFLGVREKDIELKWVLINDDLESYRVIGRTKSSRGYVYRWKEKKTSFVLKACLETSLCKFMETGENNKTNRHLINFQNELFDGVTHKEEEVPSQYTNADIAKLTAKIFSNIGS